MTQTTDAQKLQIAELLEQGLSSRKVAKAVFGKESKKSTVNNIRKKLEEEGKLDKITGLSARQGYSPDHGLKVPYPTGFRMGKVTIQRGKHGDIERTWERMVEDQERQRELIQEAILEMGEDIPKAKPVPLPFNTVAGLCNLYALTDAHVGMLAWGEESGDDWDISIAKETLLKWMSTAVDLSPKSQTGILCNLGDFLHFDGLDPVTPAHKHVLDADTRFTKLVRVSIFLIRSMIDMLLNKHENVHVIMAEGNHDLASSVWLREMLFEMYKDEPRLTIDRNPDPYYCYTWGATTLFFHHGHKARMANMDTILVSKFKSEFGNSKHVYAHCGHLHHTRMNETNLMTIEQHRTLAAKDAYASRGGWGSGRDAKVITYSKEYGEVSRITISPDMLK